MNKSDNIIVVETEVAKDMPVGPTHYHHMHTGHNDLSKVAYNILSVSLFCYSQMKPTHNATPLIWQPYINYRRIK